MPAFTEQIELISLGKTDFLDITDTVNAVVSRSKLTCGIVSIFPMHTTTCVRINENEPRLLSDLKAYLDSMVPCNGCYRHDDIDKRPVPEDEKINGHSHIKSFILGTGESAPFKASGLCLGRWQSVFFVDFDGPQKRKVTVMVVGEK
jgi:secondary thiamine-phosphate synthase enzyme